jgi:hypothetical protein
MSVVDAAKPLLGFVFLGEGLNCVQTKLLSVGEWVCGYFGDGIVGIMDCEAKCWEDSLPGW